LLSMPLASRYPRIGWCSTVSTLLGRSAQNWMSPKPNANFAIADPPLKLVLIENPDAVGALNHIGVEASSTADVTAALHRFQAAGLHHRRAGRVLPCDAGQGVRGPGRAVRLVGVLRRHRRQPGEAGGSVHVGVRRKQHLRPRSKTVTNALVPNLYSTATRSPSTFRYELALLPAHRRSRTRDPPAALDVLPVVRRRRTSPS
jgi:hypothetical protein